MGQCQWIYMSLYIGVLARASQYSLVALIKDRDYFGGAVLCVAVIRCLDAKLEALPVRTQLRRRMCGIMQSLEAKNVWYYARLLRE